MADMNKVKEKENTAGICSVIAAGRITDYAWLKKMAEQGSAVFCADGGYLHAQRAGIKPDVLLGDFDSANMPAADSAEAKRTVVYPVRKDDTDTALAVRLAVQRGYRDIRIYGASCGNRLDHTFAAVTLCREYAEKGIRLTLFDEKNEVYCLTPGRYELKKDARTLSLFALFGKVEALSESGVSYPLESYDLQPWDSLCVSNHITAQTAVISFCSGILTVVRSQD